MFSLLVGKKSLFQSQRFQHNPIPQFNLNRNFSIISKKSTSSSSISVSSSFPSTLFDSKNRFSSLFSIKPSNGIHFKRFFAVDIEDASKIKGKKKTAKRFAVKEVEPIDSNQSESEKVVNRIPENEEELSTETIKLRKKEDKLEQSLLKDIVRWHKEGEFQKIKDHLLILLEIYQGRNNLDGIATTYIRLREICREMGLMEEKEEWNQELKVFLLESGDEVAQMEYHLESANESQLSDDTETAIEHYNMALEIAKRLEDENVIIAAHLGLESIDVDHDSIGHIFDTLDAFKEKNPSVGYTLEALELYIVNEERFKKKINRLTSLDGIRIAVNGIKRIEKQQKMESYRVGLHEKMAIEYSKLLVEAGKIDKAVKALQNLLEFSSSYENSPEELLKLHSAVGSIVAELPGQGEAATEILEDALTIAQAIEEAPLKLVHDVTLSLGNVSFGMNDFTKAQRYYQASIKLAEEIDYGFGLAASYHGLGKCQHSLKMHCTALESLQKLSEKLKDIDRVNCLIEMARLLEFLGRKVEFKKVAVTALDLAKECDLDERGILELLAIKTSDQEFDYWNQRIISEVNERFETPNAQDFQMKYDALLRLAKDRIQKGKKEEAIEYLKSSMAILVFDSGEAKKLLKKLGQKAEFELKTTDVEEEEEEETKKPSLSRKKEKKETKKK